MYAGVPTVEHMHTKLQRQHWYVDRASVLASERDSGTKEGHRTNFQNWTGTSILRQGVAEPGPHINQVCYWCKRLGTQAAIRSGSQSLVNRSPTPGRLEAHDKGPV